jgi:tRNA G18 (ribose-2'-O)-methylase SpoU
MGTVFQIPWAYFDDNCPDWQAYLKQFNFKTAAMALNNKAISIDDPALCAEEKLAIVLGTEGDGLSKQVIENCDYNVIIPMYHNVDSLNVAAASAVAFWQLRKR